MVWSPWQHLTRCWGVLCRTTAMYKKRGGYRLQVLMSEELDLRYLSILENEILQIILFVYDSPEILPKLTFLMIWSILQRQTSICPSCPTTRSSCRTKNGVGIMFTYWQCLSFFPISSTHTLTYSYTHMVTHIVCTYWRYTILWFHWLDQWRSR